MLTLSDFLRAEESPSCSSITYVYLPDKGERAPVAGALGNVVLVCSTRLYALHPWSLYIYGTAQASSDRYAGVTDNAQIWGNSRIHHFQTVSAGGLSACSTLVLKSVERFWPSASIIARANVDKRVPRAAPRACLVKRFMKRGEPFTAHFEPISSPYCQSAPARFPDLKQQSGPPCARLPFSL